LSSVPVETPNSTVAEILAARTAIQSAPDEFGGVLFSDSMNAVNNKALGWDAWQKQIGLRHLGRLSIPESKTVDKAAKKARKKATLFHFKKPENS